MRQGIQSTSELVRGLLFEASMSTIIPQGELLHRAIRWLSDQRKEQPDRGGVALVEEASLRFNLSPAEEEWMIETFAKPAPADGATHS